MKDEELYHLIDLLETNMKNTLMSCHDHKSILSDSQREESILFDRDLIIKLKSKTKGK